MLIPKNKNIPSLFRRSMLVGFIIFFFANSFFESSPSSTSGLIIIPLIPICIIAVFMAGLLGTFTNWIISKLKKGKPLKPNEIYLATGSFLFVILIFSILLPYKLQSNWNSHNSPRIIRSSSVVVKSQSQEPNENIYKELKIYKIVVNFDEKYQGGDLIWNNNYYRALFDSHQFSLISKTGDYLIKENLEGYDYVRQIVCIPFDALIKSNPPLVVLANLRATSRKSMILIYSSKGECVFQELIENVEYLYPALDIVTNKPALIIELKDKQKIVYEMKFKKNN